MGDKHIGAPKGGRVHWFLFFLDEEVSKHYKISYAYLHHKYRLARYRRLTLVDEFIIIRTSLHCWRIVYFNNNSNEILYTSCAHFREASKWIKDKFNEVKKSMYQNYGIDEIKKLNSIVENYFKAKAKTKYDEAEKIIRKFLDRMKLDQDIEEVKDFLNYVLQRLGSESEKIMVDGHTFKEIACFYEEIYL